MTRSACAAQNDTHWPSRASTIAPESAGKSPGCDGAAPVHTAPVVIVGGGLEGIEGLGEILRGERRGRSLDITRGRVGPAPVV